ncbi:MAG: hypothetical protein J0H34_15525 [Rhizobiales bacterium]|nr:hypothetical protein [Hyphomicrobiales bacterium]
MLPRPFDGHAGVILATADPAEDRALSARTDSPDRSLVDPIVLDARARTKVWLWASNRILRVCSGQKLPSFQQQCLQLARQLEEPIRGLLPLDLLKNASELLIQRHAAKLRI